MKTSHTIGKIYLHWSGTDYHWHEPGFYHTVISGTGEIYRLTPYDQPLPAHTYRRNPQSVALAIACMLDHDWNLFPPTPLQLEALCQEVANLCRRLHWPAEQITEQRVLTHAEAAANRDYPRALAAEVAGWRRPTTPSEELAYEHQAIALGLPHENYGPAEWFDGWPGGYGERWDLGQLQPIDPPGWGGFVLRERIRAMMGSPIQ